METIIAAIALFMVSSFQISEEWGDRNPDHTLDWLKQGEGFSQHLVPKAVDCPLCHRKIHAASQGSWSCLGDELDFKAKDVVGVNPYLFQLWMCPNCNYCAFSWDFGKEIHPDKLKEALKKVRKYDSYLDIPYSVLLEKAELCYVTRNYSDYEWGTFYLYGAWVARDSKRPREEKEFHLKAQEKFQRVKENGTSEDQATSAYLVAEIERRYGKREKARKWLKETEVLVRKLKNQKLLSYIEGCRKEIREAEKK